MNAFDRNKKKYGTAYEKKRREKKIKKTKISPFETVKKKTATTTNFTSMSCIRMSGRST